MRDETAKDNRQTSAWNSHDLTKNNKLAVSSLTNLHGYRYQMLNVFFFYFSLRIRKLVDMNDILWKSDVESNRQDQTQLGQKNEPITSDAERRLFHVQFKTSY